MEMVCHKCGSIDLKIENRGMQNALICDDCKSWLKWVSKNEMCELKKNMREVEHKTIGVTDHGEEFVVNKQITLTTKVFANKIVLVVEDEKYTYEGLDIPSKGSKVFLGGKTLFVVGKSYDLDKGVIYIYLSEHSR